MMTPVTLHMYYIACVSVTSAHSRLDSLSQRIRKALMDLNFHAIHSGSASTGGELSVNVLDFLLSL